MAMPQACSSQGVAAKNVASYFNNYKGRTITVVGVAYDLGNDRWQVYDNEGNWVELENVQNRPRAGQAAQVTGVVTTAKYKGIFKQ
jgi:hypothetical protein